MSGSRSVSFRDNVSVRVRIEVRVEVIRRVKPSVRIMVPVSYRFEFGFRICLVSRLIGSELSLGSGLGSGVRAQSEDVGER